MEKKRKFLFFYLTTGAGHISTAKVLRESILKKYPDAEVLMVNGFDKKNYIGKLFFEHGYYMATNIYHGLFPLVYDISNNRFTQKLVLRMIQIPTIRYLMEVIQKEQPTDIVSFHFALTPLIKQTIRKLNANINFTVMVTDPFTVPTTWFYERNLNYYVYSDEAKQTAIECGVPAQNVSVVPFVLNPKYRTTYTKQDVLELKEKYGFDKNKKVLLMVGGGDGLPGAIEIINRCIRRKAHFSVAVVCGKDKAKKTYLESLGKLNPGLDLHVFGFVNFLDELVKISDCVVMKAGPATLVEMLSFKKPIVICRYIHNQELGNMKFAVNNKVGWFIQKPGDIYDKVSELLDDQDFDKRMEKNFQALTIDTNTDKIADMLMAK